MKNTTKIYLIPFIFIFSLVTMSHISAQTFTTGHAVAVSLDTENVPNGSIIISNDTSFSMSNQEYDIALFGVTSESPSTLIDDTTATNKQYVVTQGETFIRASAVNGPINEGDFLTSSNIQGTAQRATQTGQIIGTALDALSEGEATILAFVEIRTQYIDGTIDKNLIETLRNAANVPFITPAVSLRYLIAGLLILVSITLGFFNFRRVSGSSIEALGRNPLAQKSIRATVLLNFIITAAIITTGIALAVVILIL